MKKLTPILAALALAACNATETDPAQQFRDALPKTQAVQVGTYQSAGAPAGALSAARQPLGDSAIAQSEYAVMSYYLALSLNGGAGMILDLVQYITTFPTSACDPTSCTWGPWVGDMGLNRYKLVVTKQGDAFVYTLSGQNAVVADSPFVGLLTGTAHPVDRDHGSGTFTLDFDAQDALAHGPAYVKKDFGQLVVNYDNTQTPTIGAVFVGAHKADGDQDPTNDHLMNAAYGFQDAASGGELQVAFQDFTTSEIVGLRTRWSAGGAGRADAHYNGPDGLGGTVDYYASECWAGRSQNFVEVYDSKHLEIPQLADENACSPYMQASYSDIALP